MIKSYTSGIRIPLLLTLAALLAALLWGETCIRSLNLQGFS